MYGTILFWVISAVLVFVTLADKPNSQTWSMIWHAGAILNA